VLHIHFSATERGGGDQIASFIAHWCVAGCARLFVFCLSGAELAAFIHISQVEANRNKQQTHTALSQVLAKQNSPL